MKPGRCALVLPGGGARGAYQVGVLKALGEHFRGPGNPFPIITGTSAGAINAASLASHAHEWPAGIERLEYFWRNLHCHQVYRTGWLYILAGGLRWLAAMTLGGLGSANPRFLLDTAPLVHLLGEAIDFDGIERSITAGALHAAAVTASGYISSRAVSFFQGSESIAEWERTRRLGRRTRLGVEHLMASSALPLLFPARRVGNEYYGDGGLRQTAPLSPAIHLGADRLLVIGTRDDLPDPEPEAAMVYPTLGDIGGYLLDVIFMDHLNADVERLTRINNTLSHVTETERAATGLRTIRTHVIRPSEDLRAVANQYRERIPASVKFLLRGVGAAGPGRLPSYLLFEPEFLGALIDLGYADGKAAVPEVEALLCD